MAIQRISAEHTAETTVSAVALPNDEMKGRIIGREGRNIRAFEQATGVDVIIDDTPDTVIVSCFDPVRREVGPALARGADRRRPDPSRPDRGAGRQGAERAGPARSRRLGEQAAFEAGVHGLHPELVKLVGRMQYRTSLRPEHPGALEGSGLAGRASWRPS